MPLGRVKGRVLELGFGRFGMRFLEAMEGEVQVDV